MSRDTPKAPTVGHCHCPNPNCGKVAAIRRNRSGKHYAVCQSCGPIYWLTPEGQEFFLTKGTIWGAQGAPDDLPEWIREGKVAPRAPVASKPTPVQETKKILPSSERALPVEPRAASAASNTSAPATESHTAPVPPAKAAARPWWQF